MMFAKQIDGHDCFSVWSLFLFFSFLLGLGVETWKLSKSIDSEEYILGVYYNYVT